MPILTYDFQDVIAFGAEHSTMGPIVARAAARMGVAPGARSAARGGPVHPLRPLPVRAAGRAFGVPDDRLRRRRARALHRLPREPNITARATICRCRSTGRPGARFARLNYLIAREIADGAEAPRWYADSFFGDAFGGDSRARRARRRRPAAAGPKARRRTIVSAAGLSLGTDGSANGPRARAPRPSPLRAPGRA